MISQGYVQRSSLMSIKEPVMGNTCILQISIIIIINASSS